MSKGFLSTQNFFKTMVRVINYKQRESLDGKQFFILILEGGIDMVKSLLTGNFYLTSRKTSVTTTFDEATCQELVGTKLPGSIVKQECDPYEYTIKDTGEVILLDYRHVFMPDDQVPSKPQNVEADADVFSTNGIMEAAI